jgi:hypothetical protein
VDRAVLFTALIVIAVIIELSVFSSLRDYASPYVVDGRSAAQRIDSEVGDVLAARYPAVAVGSTQCPFLLDLTGRRTAQCTIPVSDLALRVEVMRPRFAPFRNVDLRPLDALVVIPDAQLEVATVLAHTYGETFDVRCPGPAIRVLTVEAPFTCSVEAPDLPRRNLDVRVIGALDHALPGVLEGVARREVRVFGREVTERERGGVVLKGATLERYVRGDAAFEARGEVGRRNLLGPAHCPPRVVLRDVEHAICSVRVGDRTQRYEARFDQGRGLVVETQQSVVVMAVLRDFATAYFERSAHAGGRPPRARVDCGTSIVALVEPGSSLPCTVQQGDKAFAFVFQIQDPQGGFTIEASPKLTRWQQHQEER